MNSWKPWGKRLGWALVSLGMVAVLTVQHVSRVPREELWVDFLDIGQGDAVLLSTPTGEHILIDGGPEQTVLEELGEVMPFLDRRIDLMVLTHPHEDHLMGLIQVLRRYEVGAVLISGVNYGGPLVEAFLAEMERQQVPLFLVNPDHDWVFGEVTIDVLYPLTPLLGTTLDNVNNASVVVAIEYHGHRILLSGDAEVEEEEAMLEEGLDLDADVFKAGHHGSRTSSTEPFLDVVTPEIVVIQSGEGNSYGHPHPETLEHLDDRDIEVHRNDLEGRIRVVCTPEPVPCTISSLVPFFPLLDSVNHNLPIPMVHIKQDPPRTTAKSVSRL